MMITYNSSLDHPSKSKNQENVSTALTSFSNAKMLILNGTDVMSKRLDDEQCEHIICCLHGKEKCSR